MDERFLHLNRHGVLAVPHSLVALTVFLLRHWLLMLILAVGMRRSPEAVQWLYSEFSWLMMVLQSPMLLLGYAMGARLPGASKLTRWAWRHGREIITVTIALNLAWTAWFLHDADVWNPWPERFVFIMGLIEAAMAIGVWRSTYYKAVFHEFPSHPDARQTPP